MNIIKEALGQFWEFYWIYRNAKVKFRVLKIGDSYVATATDGTTTVWNCFGSTTIAAKEMALYKLQQTYEEK